MRLLSTFFLILACCASVHAACTHSLPGEAGCTVVAVATPAPKAAGAHYYNPAVGDVPLHLWANYALYTGIPATEPAIGYTAAQVHSMFVANMNYNFNPKYTWTRRISIAFAGLSDVELARLTMLYVQEGGNLQAWVNMFVGLVDEHRLAAAVGTQVVINSLTPYYGAGATAYYNSLPGYKVSIIPRSVIHYQTMGLDPRAGFKAQVAPTNPVKYLDFTSYEIYLDFRTGGLALSVRAALLATAALEYEALKQSYNAGYATGNGILWVADQLSPGYSEWLASELGAAIEDAISYQSLMIPEYNFDDPGCGCTITIDWDNLVMKD